MLRKRLICIVIAVLAVSAALITLSGCGNTEKSESGGSNTESGAVTGTSETKPEGSDVDEYAVKLTYANYDYIETGDDSKEKLIRNVDSTVFGSPDSTDRIAALIEKLRKTPEGIPGAETMVSEMFRIKSVSLKLADGACTVDLDGEDAQAADMYDEMFFVYQVVDSILNSFDDVTSVRFTLDGQTVDTLNNYMDISEPFTADDVKAFNTTNTVTAQA